ncbi:MAG: helix-turn-helix domain-containing protein [Actinomycetota bacterium]|nr:helix-turn-helix domain-containing protein [Actinomycetota bacterium]
MTDQTPSTEDVSVASNLEEIEPLLLRITEVATTLGLGRTKVFALVRSGELPVVRIGRSVRVPRAALQDWVWQHLEGADEGLSRLGRNRSRRIVHDSWDPS